jgi:Ca2+-binding EF-hand superfamily protein
MLKRINAVLVVAALVALLATRGITVAQKQSNPVEPNRLSLGQEQVRQLLLMMDTDKSGKISKQEWMAYMSAEFDRLDTDKSGQLDPKELAQSSVMASHPALPQAK